MRYRENTRSHVIRLNCACLAPDSMWSVINRALRDLFYNKESWDFKNGQMQPQELMLNVCFVMHTSPCMHFLFYKTNTCGFELRELI